MTNNTPATQQHPAQAMHVLLGKQGRHFASLMQLDLDTSEGTAKLRALLATAYSVYRKGGEKMWKADPMTFLAAVQDTITKGLSLDPGMGEAYLIPRKRKVKRGDQWIDHPNGPEVQFQIGYRGVLKLARRSNRVSGFKAVVVYEHDVFEHHEGTDPRILHRPTAMADPGAVVAAYAYAREAGASSPTFRVMYRRDLDDVAASSGSPFDDKMSSVWYDHYDEMAMKTVLKRLCKWLPVPDELQAAIIEDDASEAGEPSPFRVTQEDYPDEPPPAPAPAVQGPADLNSLIEDSDG